VALALGNEAIDKMLHSSCQAAAMIIVTRSSDNAEMYFFDIS
jgi:hypothetical protein